MLITMRVAQPHVSKISVRGRQGVWQSTLEGWQLLRDQKGLLALSISVMVMNIFFAPYVVWTPFLIQDELQLPPTWYGYATGAISLGILLGSNGNWSKRFSDADRLVYYMILFLIGANFVLLGVVKISYGIIALFLVLGILTGAFNIKIVSIVQLRVAKEFHGRIFSLIFQSAFYLAHCPRP